MEVIPSTSTALLEFRMEIEVFKIPNTIFPVTKYKEEYSTSEK